MAKTPVYPSLLPRPFAESGAKRTIPDSTATHGAASFENGFPKETQLPLNAGGIAPNRLDFNGLYNIITAAVFWGQSGGQSSYSSELGYTQPSIVFHNGGLWWCLAENGPESARGVVAPGTDASVWTDLFSTLANMAGRNADQTPVGTVIMYHGTTAPAGYFALNGDTFSATENPKLRALLGSSVLPDFRGYFVRGYDTRSDVDPDGAARLIASTQGDAVRPAVGQFARVSGYTYPDEVTGVFYIVNSYNHGLRDDGSPDNSMQTFGFDISRAMPTAPEIRPKNKNLLLCIKHN